MRLRDTYKTVLREAPERPVVSNEELLRVCSGNSKAVVDFYTQAKQYLLSTEYKAEVEWCQRLKPFESVTAEQFFSHYVYVVIDSGMREQVARKTYEKFCKTFDFNVIGHLGKRKAIQEAFRSFPKWFEELKQSDNKIEYLETLPWIGPITKFHLARNMGIDTVKPDRHLVRLARRFGYKDPLEMCVEIQKATQERLGVIDVVLWRYCNLKGSRKAAEDSSLDQY